jgi:putative phosphoribosyl transferase
VFSFRTDRPPYADRAEAGRLLAERLVYEPTESGQPLMSGQPVIVGRPLVLGLPRGGIPVAGPVAAALAAPLDVLLVRKIGVPGQPELAMGAVAAIGDRTAAVRNEPVLRERLVPPAEFATACRNELIILRQQAIRYRGDREPIGLTGRLVIVVDDGLATGATMRAAVAALRASGTDRLILAVPIGSPSTCAALAHQVDGLLCPWQPPNFFSVSQGYRDFGQTSEAEVIRILSEAGDRITAAKPSGTA